MFLVQTQDMERLIIPPKYLAELRMLPEHKLSHSAALVEKHLGYYSGVDTILESRLHADVCRILLTQHLRESCLVNLCCLNFANNSLLAALVPVMAVELCHSMSSFMPSTNLKGVISPAISSSELSMYQSSPPSRHIPMFII